MSYLNPHTHKLDGQPTVVTICGSTRFRAEMTAANRDLTLAGCIVLAPGVFGHDGDEMTEQQKVDLDRLHFQKIDMADAVFVVNPGGYIGESTRREIVYARRQGKRITALVALDDETHAPDTGDPADGTPLDLAKAEIRRLQGELEQAFTRINDLHGGGTRG